MFVGEHGVFKGNIKKIDELTKGSNFVVSVECPYCKSIRDTPYWRVVRNGHHYCQACAIKIKLGKTLVVGDVYGMLEVVEPSEKSGKTICKCECGNTQEFNNCSLIAGTTKSCGCLKRKSFDNAKRVKGKYHGMWKGGVSTHRERHMQTKEYKDWRSSVFERDSYMCQKCGQVGRKLNAHHINNYADHENERVDIDNGVTLCEKCHYEFHQKYGHIKTNKIMLDEFAS